MSSDRRWYVVVTHPNAELRAEGNLRRQGFSVYLPRYLKTRRHARRVETVARPLFPRYMFVSLDLSRDRWRSVLSTFGVQSLVFSGERPAEVAAEIVDAIRQREGEDGYIALNAPSLDPGARVRILDGVFEDAVGIFERVADKRRVAVLLQLLGREVKALLPNESVAAA